MKNTVKLIINGLGILYVIKCFNNFEIFYKIGITSRSVRQRYPTSETMPYNYEIIQEIQDIPENIYNLEIQLKRLLKQFHYIPQVYFRGSKTECFTIPIYLKE